MASLKKHTFHNAETSATSNGTEISIMSNYELILVDIQLAGASALTVIFEGQGENGNWVSLLAYNSTSGSTAVQTVAAVNELWQVDVGGLKKFRTRISAQTGGTGTTIIGKVVG